MAKKQGKADPYPLGPGESLSPPDKGPRIVCWSCRERYIYLLTDEAKKRHLDMGCEVHIYERQGMRKEGGK